MSTNLGFAGRLLMNEAGRVLSFGGTVTPPVILPTPNAPVITAEDDAAQTITFSLSGGLSYDQLRYEVAGAGPYTPTSFTIQLSPTTSYLPGAVVLYVVAVAGVRNESQRVSNTTTLAAYVPPANVTPPAPTLAADDNADTLTVSSPYALAELEQRLTDGGAVAALPSLAQNVGDVDRAEGYYQVRVRAAAGRNPSGWARSAAFTKKPVSSGVPAGFAGPVPGQFISSTDSRWVLLSGQLFSFTHGSYLSQPILYFDQGRPGSREIEAYIGAGGFELHCGDTAPILLVYELLNAQNQMVFTFTLQIAQGAHNGTNQKVYTLPPGAVPPGVYKIRGTLPGQTGFGVFDRITLL